MAGDLHLESRLPPGPIIAIFGSKNMDWAFDISAVQDFSTALLIGALIGIEREKRKSSENEPGIGGFRTFILFAEVGAIAGWLSRNLEIPWLLAGAVVAVASIVVVGYLAAARVEPQSIGLTTEIAAIVVVLLGGMTTLGHRELAIGLAVVTAAVLAYKQPLHGLVGKIGWDDVFAGLRLLIATFVVLPLLPNRTVDPWDSINPFSLWLLVLLISGISLVGYVSTRLLGMQKGTALTGLTGGLVSSTAVTLSFARRSRDSKLPGIGKALACGILLAWVVMFARVIIEILVVNPSLLTRVLVPFSVMGLITGVFAWVFFQKSTAGQRGGEADLQVPLKNPFSLSQAAKFAAFFALVLLLVEIVREHFSTGGIYIVSALAGLTDVDAITLSMADYAKTGSPAVAVNAIVIAVLTNTLIKFGMAATLGGAPLKRPLFLATAAIIAGGLAALLLA